MSRMVSPWIAAVRAYPRRLMVACAFVMCAACNPKDSVSLSNTANLAPWTYEWAPIPETTIIRDGVFANDHDGWLVGDYGLILHTTNGGEQFSDWSPQTPLTSRSLRSVAIATTATTTTVVAAGDGVVLVSKAGSDWRVIKTHDSITSDLHICVRPDSQKIEAIGLFNQTWLYTDDLESSRFQSAAAPVTDALFEITPECELWALGRRDSRYLIYRRRSPNFEWESVPLSNRMEAAANPTKPRRGERFFKTFADGEQIAPVTITLSTEQQRIWAYSSTPPELDEYVNNAWLSYTLSAATPQSEDPSHIKHDVFDGKWSSGLRLHPYSNPPVAEFDFKAQDTLKLMPRSHASALRQWAAASDRHVFSATSLVTSSTTAWALSIDGVHKSTDGGHSWTTDVDLSTFVKTRNIGKIVFSRDGTQAWAIGKDNKTWVMRDNNWISGPVVPSLEYPQISKYAAQLSNGGRQLWLTTPTALISITSTEAKPFPVTGGSHLVASFVCEDGDSGEGVLDDGRWLVPTAHRTWSNSSLRPSLPCVSESCGLALATANSASDTICETDTQIWSIRRGQSANGTTWAETPTTTEYHLSTIDRVTTNTTSLIGLSSDGTIFTTQKRIMQSNISEIRGRQISDKIEFSWTLIPAASAAPPK